MKRDNLPLQPKSKLTEEGTEHIHTPYPAQDPDTHMESVAVKRTGESLLGLEVSVMVQQMVCTECSKEFPQIVEFLTV